MEFESLFSSKSVGFRVARRKLSHLRRANKNNYINKNSQNNLCHFFFLIDLLIGSKFIFLPLVRVLGILADEEDEDDFS